MIDVKIIEECKNGNYTNFRKVVDQTSPFVFSLALRMLGDEELARDVVQETMVTIWKKIPDIKTTAVFRTWIYRIVTNKCYDQMRNRKRNREDVADEKTWNLLSGRISQQPSARLENEEIARIIELLTEYLSPRQKTIFVLSEIEELSGDEISEMTGISKAVIKANLYHARKSISQMLEKFL